jgi:pantothenate kinase
MPDAESLHARRGAHWTFNAHEFVAAMHRVQLVL